MPPIPPGAIPRIVIYHQTHHKVDGTPVSILPLVSQPHTRVSHVIIAAIHLNDPPSRATLHLNDQVPHHARFSTLWAEIKTIQASGVKVLGMLGGAAKGTFHRLDQDATRFEAYYEPLRNFIQERGLDGLDLDIEEPMTLGGVVRLIDRLKTDFGSTFIITLAPVAAALISHEVIKNYAEFSYEALEVMRGHQIEWYNTQFYCGWGNLSSTAHFDMIMMRGFPARKIVVGMITNPANGPGWVPFDVLKMVLVVLESRYPGFGGVMGWEYFNALPGDTEKPWEWATWMTSHFVWSAAVPPAEHIQTVLPKVLIAAESQIPNKAIDDETEEAPLAIGFEYFSDE